MRQEVGEVVVEVVVEEEDKLVDEVEDNPSDSRSPLLLSLADRVQLEDAMHSTLTWRISH